MNNIKTLYAIHLYNICLVGLHGVTVTYALLCKEHRPSSEINDLFDFVVKVHSFCGWVQSNLNHLGILDYN